MNYYHISKEDLGHNAKVPLLKFKNSEDVFHAMACDMVATIKQNNEQHKPTVFICPVGPVGQYPMFVSMVNDLQLNLTHCWFINMDEYLNEDETYINFVHKLSFRGFMEREVYSKILPNLLMPPSQRLFPDPQNLNHIQEVIEHLGGVDVAFGGIGINGHLAFNEPENHMNIEQFSSLSTRILQISAETRTANAIGDLNGAIELMPQKCITIGMKQILNARRVVLGVFRPWHRAVVRRVAYGEVTPHFPATLLQHHANAIIYVNDVAADCPLE